MKRLIKNKFDITVFITSSFQRELTIETAIYYSKMCSEVIIADEEQPTLHNDEINTMSKRGITYFNYKNEDYNILNATGYNKRLIAASQSTNKYVVHSNHDERYTHLGLKACIAELEKDKSLTFCIGQAIAVRRNESGIYFTRSYKNLCGYKNINKINQRLYYHAKIYAPLAHYSLWRKQSYIDATEEFIRIQELIPSSTILEEVVFELAADMTGNSVALPELLWIRKRINAPVTMSLDKKITRGEEAFVIFEKYLNVLFESLDDIQLNIIMNNLRVHFFNVVTSSKLRRKINSLIKRSLFFLKERKRLSDVVEEWQNIDALLHQNNIIYDKLDISNVLKSMDYKDNSHKLLEK